MKFNLLSFKRCPYDNDFWPINFGDLNLFLGDWNVFTGNCNESCHQLFFLNDTINPSKLFIFTNVIPCFRLPFWVGYFNYFKLQVLVQYFINHYIFSSIKVTNWLINKEMDVLLFDVIKYLLLRKTDVLKTCQKSKLLGKKIWRNALALNVDFRDIMNVSPNILASKKWNFKNWDMVLQMKEHR